ncbi:exosome non-catalytic core subunit rrp40 [Exophiala dermatitidis]|nr:exosome non-catalytic core subunit rrp40 [Exophiala dermatitidis]
MATPQIVLPGEHIPATLIPTSQKRKIGHGLLPDPESDSFIATIGGLLQVDWRKKSAQISTPNARYIPKPGDLAILPQLAFEGATKKTRPQLKANDLVYAKVVSAQKNMDIELSCVNPSTGKSEPDGLGPLSGGMVFDVSPGLAERLLKKQNVLAMDELGSRLQGGFEIAVGKNGKVWVDCPEAGVRGICAVGRCLWELDEREMGEKEQKKLVNKILGDLERG